MTNIKKKFVDYKNIIPYWGSDETEIEIKLIPTYIGNIFEV